MGSMSKEQSFKLLDAFYEAGGNFIDTAVSLLSRLHSNGNLFPGEAHRRLLSQEADPNPTKLEAGN